jgi:hypothetical protein
MSLIDDKWEILFDKYSIESRVKQEGLFYITADQIREVKEPRLMTKFDTRESLPTVFGSRLGILPVTRGKYVIGEFDLYRDFPEFKTDIKQMKNARLPDYLQTIDINDVRSEAGAINIIGIAAILDDFLAENNMLQTVSGRMGSGVFSFRVNGFGKGVEHLIDVQNSQVEIDAGFENEHVFTIIEGKNVVHSNFLIRQLYYPMRLWEAKITKPIRPIFMIYSNNIFRLLEYEFTDISHYNSIRFVQEKKYSLEDIDISMEDIVAAYKSVVIEPEPEVTFVQADSFDKVISLIENLNDSPMTTVEIAELFGFKERQSDYYYNACKYLRLAEKARDEEGVTRVYITALGKHLLKMPYKARQLEYVKLIMKHRIFNEIFELVLKCGEIPDKNFIANRMRELNICSEKLLQRRASSVRGWLSWILNLVSRVE